MYVYCTSDIIQGNGTSDKAEFGGFFSGPVIPLEYQNSCCISLISFYFYYNVNLNLLWMKDTPCNSITPTMYILVYIYEREIGVLI